MAKKYLVFGEMTKDDVTINFKYEVAASNEYMAAILTKKQIEFAFSHSAAIRILEVQRLGDRNEQIQS